MNEKSPRVEGSWAPSECTLSTGQRPARLAGFDDLFATGVIAIRRITPELARLELRAEPMVAARAADLAVQETRCCSFFTFTQIATGGSLALEVVVPSERIAVLDAVVDRASAKMGVVSR